MKRKSSRKRMLIVLVLVAGLLLTGEKTDAQCSICTRTAQQLGEKPARGMNAGILYLAFAPLGLIGFITYRWLKKNKTG